MTEKDFSVTVSRSMDNMQKVDEEMESLIRANVDFDSDEEQQKFLQDMQLVISELFSNAVNYSTSNEVNIGFNFNSEHFHIAIETEGKGFCLKPNAKDESSKKYMKEYFPPYPDAIINEEIVVYKDSENVVKCLVKAVDRIEFKHQKIEPKEENLSELNEHYGLYLINAICDKVNYQKKENGKHLFLVKKKLNK